MNFWRILRNSMVVLLALGLIAGIGRIAVMAWGGIYHGERAPYLQLPATTAITIRWQTSAEERGVVQYGLSPGQWLGSAQESHVREAHEVRLSGLTPATRYYYAVGTDQHISYGGNTDYWFETSPPTGAPVAVRGLVLGDPGYANDGAQARVRDAARQWLQQHARPGRADLDLLLATGDLAYSSGSNPQFQENFFQPYAALLRNTPVWPTYGNHDARRWAYFKIFNLPANAEAGGVASATEYYYSLDYGSVHVVVLDSHATVLSKGGRMYDWLQRDLQATQQPWLIAMFHHPPYTKGTHDSDSWRDSWGRMVEMRKNYLPLLEQYGVDLVLSGHSHMYERSYLLDCHYGTSDSLKPFMIRSKDAQSVYHKQSLTRGPHQGTVYAVVGSSAKLDNGMLNHPVLPGSRHERGTLMFDVEGNTLHARFINENSAISDEFTIIKGVATGVSSNAECHQTQ